jgi:anti-anti-sigma factor
MSSNHIEEHQFMITRNKNVGTIHVGKHFIFPGHRQFRSAYSTLIIDSLVHTIEIDLANVVKLDSSALGMLLILRDKSKLVGKSLLLVRPNQMVASVFEISNFHKLFSV